MQPSTLSRIVGPYRLHAAVGAVFVLFLGFLWLFNFTSFFNSTLN